MHEDGSQHEEILYHPNEPTTKLQPRTLDGSEGLAPRGGINKRVRRIVFGVGKDPNKPIPIANEVQKVEVGQKKREVLVEKNIGRGKRRFCFKFPEVNKELRVSAQTSDTISPLLECSNCIYPAEVISARFLSSDAPNDSIGAEEPDIHAMVDASIEEDHKVEVRRILTALSKTFRTLRTSLTDLSPEKSYQLLFPAVYGFYFYNNPELPLVLDAHVKVESFTADGIQFSVTDYGQFIAYDTQRTIWGEAAYYAQDCQYIPVNLQPCKLLMIMASEFGKILSYYDLYARFFDISGYVPDAADDRLRRAAYHEDMFDHPKSKAADETVTHGWHRADEFQQKIAKLLYRLNQAIPPQLQIIEKRGVGYGLYPR